MKQIIRLTEGDLRKIVKESVKKVIKEMERSFPNSVPGDEDIHYPGDINPDVWDSLQRGDYGQDEEDWPEDRILDRIDTEANMDDLPADIH